VIVCHPYGYSVELTTFAHLDQSFTCSQLIFRSRIAISYCHLTPPGYQTRAMVTQLNRLDCTWNYQLGYVIRYFHPIKIVFRLIFLGGTSGNKGAMAYFSRTRGPIRTCLASLVTLILVSPSHCDVIHIC
jgi:hypothetical protein